MGAYQRQSWNKVLPVLQAAPEETRAAALNVHLETTLAKQRRLALHHTADAASKSLTSAISLRRHAWQRSAGINDDTRSHIEELPFEGMGLFNENR